MQQVAQAVERRDVRHRRQRRQRVPAKRRLFLGRLGQRRRRLRLIEIGQRFGRVEPHLRIARLQPLLAAWAIASLPIASSCSDASALDVGSSSFFPSSCSRSIALDRVLAQGMLRITRR